MSNKQYIYWRVQDVAMELTTLSLKPFVPCIGWLQLYHWSHNRLCMLHSYKLEARPWCVSDFVKNFVALVIFLFWTPSDTFFISLEIAIMYLMLYGSYIFSISLQIVPYFLLCIKWIMIFCPYKWFFFCLSCQRWVPYVVSCIKWITFPYKVAILLLILSKKMGTIVCIMYQMNYVSPPIQVVLFFAYLVKEDVNIL